MLLNFERLLIFISMSKLRHVFTVPSTEREVIVSSLGKLKLNLENEKLMAATLSHLLYPLKSRDSTQSA